MTASTTTIITSTTDMFIIACIIGVTIALLTSFFVIKK